MGRVEVKAASSSQRAIREIALSKEIAAMLRPTADQVLAAASTDPNDRYVETLDVRVHRSRGPLGRVSWRVGSSIPELGMRVEAERGTLARALGAAGA